MGKTETIYLKNVMFFFYDGIVIVAQEVVGLSVCSAAPVLDRLGQQFIS